MNGQLPRHNKRVDPFLVEAITQGLIFHGTHPNGLESPAIAPLGSPRELVEFDYWKITMAQNKRDRRIVKKLDPNAH